MPRKNCPKLNVKFKKTTQSSRWLTPLVAELSSEFKPPEGIRVRVLFDSYYLCPVVVKSCRKKGFHFVSVLKANRNLCKNGRKLKAGGYGHRLFSRQSKNTSSICKSKGWVTYTCVDAGWMQVSDLGRLHVVFSRQKPREQTPEFSHG